MTADHQPNDAGELLIYRDDDGGTVRVLLEGESVWLLTQAQIAEPYQTTPQNVTQHLKAIYDEGELEEAATCKDYLQVRQEGKRNVSRRLKHYRLEVVLASDYQADEQHTQRFFASTQNKMHYVATDLTAAEIIRQRADAERPNMGLTNWKGGRVIKRDIATAKNYLDAQEIDTLNRITVMFLDQAEFRAMRRQDIKMGDWEAFLDKFLSDTELPVLQGAGRVSHAKAQNWAVQQYDAFAERRRLDAEQQAEARYLEDLRSSAKVLQGARVVAPAKKTRSSKKNK